MTVNILVSLINNLNPVINATVDFFLDPTSSPTASFVTNSNGTGGVALNPGTYHVQITNGAVVTLLDYVVKGSVPSNFSGIEMLTGIPGSTSGTFVPQRFRNTRYYPGTTAITNNLVQKVTWSI